MVSYGDMFTFALVLISAASLIVTLCNSINNKK